MLHRMAIAIDLGDAGEALDVAERTDVSGLLPERQARFWLDVGRAHAQRRHVGAATLALVQAEQLSPELVRDHRVARDTIAVLLRIAGDDAPGLLVDLAARAAVDA
jgi:hypothetical protein